MKSLKLMLVGAVALGLTACEGAGEKEQLGTIVGAVAGAVIGAQVGKGRGRDTGIALGALLGSLAGSSIGKSLDRADKIYLQKTQHQALEKSPMGTTSEWNNPDSGNSGTVTPRKTFKTAQGTYCREFQQTITVGGRSEEAYGTACRQPDGTWKTVK